MAKEERSGNQEECQEKRSINAGTAYHLWTDKQYSANMIAKEMGFSRTGIIKCLNKHGVNTSKAVGSWVTIKCKECGKKVQHTKSRARNNEKHFCSTKCYYSAIYNPNFIECRQGARIARKVISEVFNIQSNHIPHHKDGNERNNNLSNLMVFKNHAEHMKWHRLDNPGITPLFNGSEYG